MGKRVKSILEHPSMPYWLILNFGVCMMMMGFGRIIFGLGGLAALGGLLSLIQYWRRSR
jgi:hypothetical protein